MYTIDSETYLIGPGRLAPSPVCLQCAHDMEQPFVLVIGVDRVRDFLKSILCSGELIVGHNVAYDLLVFARQYPDLMPHIFQAYIDDHIADTIVREKLRRIADGTFWRRRGSGWSLSTLAGRYGKTKDSNDPWRLRYSELWGVPFSQWPLEAQQYAVGDVIATRQVYLRQAVPENKKSEEIKETWLNEDKKDWSVSPDEYRQTRAAWMLHIIGANGVHTDLEQIQHFEKCERDLYEQDKAKLQAVGLVRPDGSRDMKLARERMEQVIQQKGGVIARTEKGAVSLDEEACLNSGDALLQAYQRYGSRKNLLTRIQALYRGVDQPINPSFDSLMETGRTSCRKAGGGIINGYQLQNMRRVQGERECFRPRSGNVFLACDYSTIELRTLAQCCLWAVGGSELAEVLKAGGDPHLALGAETLNMDFAEARNVYRDLNHPLRASVKNARQVCKVANFGFPGGMSSSTFCAYARGYGIELSEVESRLLQERWFNRWREMAFYFKWIREAWPWKSATRKGRQVQVTTIRQFVSQRVRANITYTTACNSFFQGLAADLGKAAGFALVMECELGELQGWKVWNFVHDEYILEGPENDAHRAAEVVQRIMVDEAQKWIPDIPVQAEPALMRRWSKKAEPVYDDNGKLIPWEDRGGIS